MNEQFENYRDLHSKDKKTNKIKTFYYSTNLHCDLHNYQIPCLKDCEICNLALQGFGQVISASESGVTLNKDPWMAHKKTQPRHENPQMYSLLVCDVDYGNSTKKAKRTMSDGQPPLSPLNHDAVRIKKTNSLMKTASDSIVVYNSDTVCPRYILLYEI